MEAVPEIKILKENGGLIQSYVGPRKSGEEMADFLKQQNFPTSYLVETEYAANFLVESQHLIVVFYFSLICPKFHQFTPSLPYLATIFLWISASI